MIYNAVQSHVQEAFDVTREELAAYNDPTFPLKPKILKAGPLVD
jgi:hypothetical protein